MLSGKQNGIGGTEIDSRNGWSEKATLQMGHLRGHLTDKKTSAM